MAVPAFETTRPSAVTCPARINARARSRDGARPCATSSWSSRSLLLATLVAPRDDPVGDCAELIAGQSGLLERLVRPREALIGELPRALESKQARVGGLVAGSILARRLAQR